ncbi:MAG: amylo-alpha-1,6-glucosidase [Kineosporiaceae bacterium]
MTTAVRTRAGVDGLDAVLSEEGWVYASSASAGPGDPGRFHALFGRDALITALQLLPVRPDIARATLRALADRQGRQDDPATLEQPGKIGHEFRDTPPESFLAHGWPDAGPFAYYGTSDATSWFLVVLAALEDGELVRELEPSWRAAGGWLERALADGGGLVRHAPGTWPGGLAQQGWRDARDPVAQTTGVGMLRPDGSAPEPPLADADTQAVTVAALRAMARLSGDAGWAGRAASLRARVTAAFVPDVLLLEAGDRPVRGAGSQLGWLLWAGAVDDDALDAVADRLTRPDIMTPFGFRTLATTAGAFDWRAYHRGAVWPFDTWLGWAGLRAAGREQQAERVRAGVLDALARIGDHPELVCVDLSGRLHVAPVANRVQAWTLGARWALMHEWHGRVH